MIIDCTIFFNELDLLEIRLNELAGVVDFFVLTEATLTHQGNKKPLYFDDNKDRFSEFNIVHVVANDFSGVDFSDPWSLENYQRQCGVEYCKQLKLTSNDVVLLSDIDEIWSAKTVKKYATSSGWKRARAIMVMFFYWFNCFKTNKAWFHPRWIKGDSLGKWPLRCGDFDTEFMDTGWHFSYTGDIKEKLASFSHLEFNKPPWNTDEYIDSRKANFQSLFDDTSQFKILRDLSYLPKHILNNPDKFGKYLYNGAKQ